MTRFWTTHPLRTAALALLLAAACDRPAITGSAEVPGAPDAGSGAGREGTPSGSDEPGSDASPVAGSPDAGAEAAAGEVAGPDPVGDACAIPVVYQNLDPTTMEGQAIHALLPDPAEVVTRVSRTICRLFYKQPAEVPRRVMLKLVLEHTVMVAGQDVTGYALPSAGEVHIGARILAARAETLYQVLGVLHHEYCHVWQSRGPSFLIEGICDYVRFKSGYFKTSDRPRAGNFRDGYPPTGFFLAWVDEQYPDFMHQLNQRLKAETYQDSWFVDLTGKDVDTLWQQYQATAPP